MITRGFQGRPSHTESKRLPPGQHLTRDFPVLSAGPTPRTALTPGPFALEAEDGTPLASWNWDEFRALGSTETGRVGRIDLRAVTALLEGLGGVADSFVCGPDGFVEVASAH